MQDGDVVEIKNISKNKFLSPCGSWTSRGNVDNKHCEIDATLRPDSLFNYLEPNSGLRKWKIIRVS